MNNHLQELATLFNNIDAFYRLDIITRIETLEPNYLQDSIFHALITAVKEDHITDAKAIAEVYSYAMDKGIAVLLGLEDKFDSVNLGSVMAAKSNTQFEFNLEPDIEEEALLELKDVFKPTQVPETNLKAKDVLKDFSVLPEEVHQALLESLTEGGEGGEEEGFIDRPLPITVLRHKGEPISLGTAPVKLADLFSNETQIPTQVSREPKFKVETRPGYYTITPQGHFSENDYKFGKTCVMLCFNHLLDNTANSIGLTIRDMNKKMLTIAQNSNYAELGKRGLNLMYICRKRLSALGYLRQIEVQKFNLTAKGKTHLTNINKSRFQENIDSIIDE